MAVGEKRLPREAGRCAARAPGERNRPGAHCPKSSARKARGRLSLSKAEFNGVSDVVFVSGCSALRVYGSLWCAVSGLRVCCFCSSMVSSWLRLPMRLTHFIKARSGGEHSGAAPYGEGRVPAAVCAGRCPVPALVGVDKFPRVVRVSLQ